MGARSQVSGLLAAGFVALVLLFLTGPIADLPKAVLGAVIVGACVGLVAPAEWRALWHADRVEFAIAAHHRRRRDRRSACSRRSASRSPSRSSTSCAAAPAPTTRCWAGCRASAATATSPCTASAVVTPGVVVYRLDDRLFFANAGYVKGRVREALRAAPSVTAALVLDASGMSHVDTAGLDALTDLESNLGVELYVARARGDLEAQLSEVAPRRPLLPHRPRGGRGRGPAAEGPAGMNDRDPPRFDQVGRFESARRSARPG